LHAERTSLAWQRAALAALLLSSANMVVTARAAGTASVLSSAVATSLAAVATWRTVPRRVTRLRDQDVAEHLLESPFGRLMWSASAVIGLALAALVGLVGR
jgi:hypothetical protein